MTEMRTPERSSVDAEIVPSREKVEEEREEQNEGSEAKKTTKQTKLATDIIRLEASPAPL